MVQFILARWSKTKSKERESTYSILVIFTLGIGLQISWKDMELTSLHQEKCIKDSSRKDLKKDTEDVFIQMVSVIKAFGAKTIRSDSERWNFRTRSFLLGFSNQIALKLKDFSWDQLEKMEIHCGKIKASLNTITGRKTLWFKAKKRRRNW